MVRSYLFVPGDQPRKLARAVERGADALIVDLEDAVVPDRKGVARRETASWLDGYSGSSPQVWVRVNNVPDWLEADLGLALHRAVTGIVVPKVDSAREIEALADRMGAREAEGETAQGRTRVIPMVESARGLLAAPEIAGAPRVERMMLGEVDLAADLGVDPTEGRAMMPLRMQVVVASAAAGIEPPVGPVFVDYQDLDGLRIDTADLRRAGFSGRPAIHPDQIAVINHVFTPDPGEIERARDLLDHYERARDDGRGVAVGEDGRMVDLAVVRAARRIVELADRLGRR